MRTSRRSYLLAMVSGLAIIGGSSVGVSLAQSRHLDSVAAGGDAPVAATVRPPGDSSAGPSAVGSSSAARATPSSTGVTRSTPASRPAGTSSAASRSGTQPATRSAGPSDPRRATASSSAPPTASSSGPPPAPSTSAAAGRFKDGSYSAVGSYNSPGGEQQIGVTLTLAGDKVTAASVDLKAQGLASTYQKLFASGYLPEVVGKDISSISLGAVAGSSLTGTGFNAAVDQIEAQARG